MMSCYKILRALLPLLALAIALNACKRDPAAPAQGSSVADAPRSVTHELTFETRINGYVGKGGDIDGVKNPTIKVKKGDVVKITLINQENMAHDLYIEGQGLGSAPVMKVGERTEFTFTATGSDTYYCTLPGHRQAGMVGKIEVEGADGAPVEQAVGADDHGPKKHASSATLESAQKVQVAEIGRAADDVPPPLPRRKPQTVPLTLRSTEVVAALDDGTTFTYWTFEDTVPGPLLRVREGDTVEVTLENAETSTMVHSVDFHAATGPGGGAAFLQVPPGEKRALRFKTLAAGLYIYHCATPHIPTHLARGMYGMILVEPPEGLGPVEREFYVVQGDLYTTAMPGTKGHQTQDDDRLFEEQPTYVVFNGRIGSLTGSRTLKAKVNDRVRIYFGVGGPNTISAFHVIGEIFDKVWPEGTTSPPLTNVQTTLVPPGGTTIVEFKVDYPGKYLLVDHALTRLDKGAVGILEVEGEADAAIYEPLK
jgi:nitrite reductase (NO-forming)